MCGLNEHTFTLYEKLQSMICHTRGALHVQALKLLADFQQTTRRPTGPIATMDRSQSVQKRLHPHLNLNRRAVESMSIPTIGPEILVPGSDGNLQEVNLLTVWLEILLHLAEPPLPGTQ